MYLISVPLLALYPTLETRQAMLQSSWQAHTLYGLEIDMLSYRIPELDKSSAVGGVMLTLKKSDAKADNREAC